MNKTRVAVASLGLLLLAACGGGGDSPPKNYAVSGVVQKGPFALGTSVRINELDDGLVPTGRAFDTTISSDTGTFELPNVVLSSPYVALTADGFYFDEVAGNLSSSRIQLGALADVTSASAVNANLLSHLVQGRVKKLLAEGSNLADAKAQAQAELLAVFGVTKTVATAESLDIAKGSEDDTILLAISAIVQGRRTPAELTELCAQISADLTPDGTLSDSLGLKLAVSAAHLNAATVRANLAARYEALGATATIGDFESILKTFVATTPFLPAGEITYPDPGIGDSFNLLASSVMSVPFGGDSKINLSANVPVGKWVRVQMKITGGLFIAPASDGGWLAGWIEGKKEGERATYIFTAEASETATLRDVRISNTTQIDNTPSSVLLEVFENGAATPSFTKTIVGE